MSALEFWCRNKRSVGAWNHQNPAVKNVDRDTSRALELNRARTTQARGARRLPAPGDCSGCQLDARVCSLVGCPTLAAGAHTPRRSGRTSMELWCDLRVWVRPRLRRRLPSFKFPNQAPGPAALPATLDASRGPSARLSPPPIAFRSPARAPGCSLGRPGHLSSSLLYTIAMHHHSRLPFHLNSNGPSRFRVVSSISAPVLRSPGQATLQKVALSPLSVSCMHSDRECEPTLLIISHEATLLVGAQPRVRSFVCVVMGLILLVLDLASTKRHLSSV